ncbi:hypothetical protein CF319_g7346 [Tilletia indica]|nr:hypothetical protein CF319_g7346 [Tilletia indica]
MLLCNSFAHGYLSSEQSSLRCFRLKTTFLPAQAISTVWTPTARSSTSRRMRLVGPKFANRTVHFDMKHWSSTVIDQGTEPIVQVEYKNETKTSTYEEVAAMVMLKMRETAASGSPQRLRQGRRRHCSFLPHRLLSTGRSGCRHPCLSQGHAHPQRTHRRCPCLRSQPNVFILGSGGVAFDASVSPPRRAYGGPDQCR